MNLTEFYQHFFWEGSFDAHQYFGAHPHQVGPKKGYVFRVFAPNATNVSVVGDFNGWQEGKHKAKKVHEYGIYEVFIPQAKPHHRYKFAFTNAHGVRVQKADPYARYAEVRPLTASIVTASSTFAWDDGEYLKQRTRGYDRPISIYEVHLGSWKKDKKNQFLSYEAMEKELIPYVLQHGFTHIEIMPLTQYPFDGSWGYQATGFTALDSRYGSIEAFKHFVNACHQAGIGIILDYVVVHFASDGFGLIEFDGTKLYEYFDPQKTYSQWGSPQFDLGRFVARSLLFSGIRMFVDEFHVDGIRIDAVSNMVYWDGNHEKGHNLGGISFLKQLNQYIHTHYPSVMMIAEDSTAFPGVTRSVEEGGLGFDYKWDMGWMNDTLKYYGLDDVYKYYDHHKLTFSMHYFYAERFLLPLSHDEVVHGKGTILNKMHGDYDTKFERVKNLYTYQMTHPGKKLNFMGNELASFDEWNENKGLPWFFLDFPKHAAIQSFLRDLNRVYRDHPALYQGDSDLQSFRWIMVDNAFDSIFVFQRKVYNSTLVMVFNMKGNYYNEYVLHGCEPGTYVEILNSTHAQYGGHHVLNDKPIVVSDHRLNLRIGSHAAIILKKLESPTKE